MVDSGASVTDTPRETRQVPSCIVSARHAMKAWKSWNRAQLTSVGLGFEELYSLIRTLAEP